MIIVDNLLFLIKLFLEFRILLVFLFENEEIYPYFWPNSSLIDIIRIVFLTLFLF